MESNKLAILDNKLPLRAYPEKKLNEILNTSFKFWLANLLSIKADNEQKLDLAIPIIKDLFWSLGLNETKKAFEMYALGKLNLIPKSNYMDIVLVGQIFNEYKSQKVGVKKAIPPPTISEEEKQRLISNGMKKCLEYWNKTETILDGYLQFLYDIFYEDGFLPNDKEIKIKAYNDAKFLLSMKTSKKAKNVKEHNQIKEFAQEITKKNSPSVILKAKELMVMRFLRETYRNESLVNDLKTRYKCN